MPCEVWLVSQSRSRSKLQASQKRLQSCTAQRNKTRRAARAVSPLSHAFSLVLVRTSTVRGRALLREGQVSQVSCLRGAALSIHHPGWRASHGSDRGHPWLGECSPLQSCPSAPSLSTAGAAAHSWLFFFVFSSLLFLIPALIPCFFCLSKHWLFVSSLPIFSSLQKHPEYRAAHPVLSLTSNLHLQHQVNSLNGLFPTSQCLLPKSTATWPAMSNPLSYRYARNGYLLIRSSAICRVNWRRLSPRY